MKRSLNLILLLKGKDAATYLYTNNPFRPIPIELGSLFLVMGGMNSCLTMYVYMMFQFVVPHVQRGVYD